EAVHQRVDVLGVEGVRDGEGARHVCDQDGDFLALAFLRVTEDEDVARQVARRIGRGGRRLVASERRTAVQTEEASRGKTRLTAARAASPPPARRSFTPCRWRRLRAGSRREARPRASE